MIPTEDASARKREIEEKLKQVRHGCRGRGITDEPVNDPQKQNGSPVLCLLLQEQETLSFIRENLEKSDQLTKGMVGWKHVK